LSTYVALAEEGVRLGWSPAMLDKLERVRAQGLRAVEMARAEGVPIVFGTDLLGHMQPRQSGEFALRAPAVGPVETLQSATITAARLMRQEGQIGEIVRGAHADLLIVDGDPTRDVSVLAEPARSIRLVMKGGRVYRDKLMDVETA
jgi:imidazolonepropionase-like amidohydrolase